MLSNFIHGKSVNAYPDFSIKLFSALPDDLIPLLMELPFTEFFLRDNKPWSESTAKLIRFCGSLNFQNHFFPFEPAKPHARSHQAPESTSGKVEFTSFSRTFIFSPARV